MNGKGASEDLPCDVKALVLQLVPPPHPRPQDPLVLAALQGGFLEDTFVLAGGQGGFLEDTFALAGGQGEFLVDPFVLAAVQGEVLAWVSCFLAFPAVHRPQIFFLQDVRVVCQQTPPKVSLHCREEKDLAVFGKLGMVSSSSSSLAEGRPFVPPTQCSLVIPPRVSPETECK